MRHGSLFSGIGGFDLAAEWIGWENVFHCELEAFNRQVLNYYWPNADSHTNIKELDGTQYEGTIDIISGGFPCQPFSQAGKRKGKEDERHLWPEMLRIIREVKPTYVVGENVSGLLSWNEGMVFEEVHADLEDAGYEVQAFVLPACAKDAPHRRDRVWIVAHLPDARPESMRRKRKDPVHGHKPTSNSNTKKRDWCSRQSQSERKATKQRRHRVLRPTPRPCAFGSIANAKGKRRGKLRNTGKTKRPQAGHELFRKQYPIPDWDNFPTVSPIHIRDDGLSERLDGITLPKWRRQSIKAAGNAIVPQIAYEIFKAIEQTDESFKQTPARNSIKTNQLKK